MGDHLCTCVTHSGAKKGRHCGDIQLEGYLENVTDPVPLVLDLRITHDRLQKQSRRCDVAHDGGFALQSTFFGALQRRAAPENLMWRHQTRKTFDGPPSPVPQGECVPLNSRMNSKHDYQLAPLLGASVHALTFFAARACTSAFFELPRTRVSGHHGRTGAALDVGSLGKATPLHFHKSFTFFWGKKRHLNSVSQFKFTHQYWNHVISRIPELIPELISSKW